MYSRLRCGHWQEVRIVTKLFSVIDGIVLAWILGCPYWR